MGDGPILVPGVGRSVLVGGWGFIVSQFDELIVAISILDFASIKLDKKLAVLDLKGWLVLHYDNFISNVLFVDLL